MATITSAYSVVKFPRHAIEPWKRRGRGAGFFSTTGISQVCAEAHEGSPRKPATRGPGSMGLLLPPTGLAPMTALSFLDTGTPHALGGQNRLKHR